MLLLGLAKRAPKAIQRDEARAVANSLSAQVTRATYQATQAARRFGVEALESQFDLHLFGSGNLGRFRDAIHAHQIGERFGRDWLRKLTPANDGSSLLQPPKILGRLQTIGTTEAARAFDNERAEVARSQLVTRFDLIEIWDATLDSRACSFCYSMDGERAGAGGFAGGVRPGDAHPRCRCCSHYEPRGPNDW